MSDAKPDSKSSLAEELLPMSMEELPGSVEQKTPGGSGPAQPSKDESWLSKISTGSQNEKSLNAQEKESSNPSGTETSNQNRSTSNQKVSSNVSCGNVTLRVPVLVSTATPTRDPRYSRVIVGKVTVVIYEDSSVTVDMEGKIDGRVIRGQVQRAILEAFNRSYKPALKKAIEESLKKETR